MSNMFQQNLAREHSMLKGIEWKLPFMGLVLTQLVGINLIDPTWPAGLQVSLIVLLNLAVVALSIQLFRRSHREGDSGSVAAAGRALLLVAVLYPVFLFPFMVGDFIGTAQQRQVFEFVIRLEIWSVVVSAVWIGSLGILSIKHSGRT